MQPDDAGITASTASTKNMQSTIAASTVHSTANSTVGLILDLVPPLTQHKEIGSRDQPLINPSILTITITLPLPTTAPQMPTSSGVGVSASGMPDPEDTEISITGPIESTYPTFWHHRTTSSTPVAAPPSASYGSVTGFTTPVPLITLSTSLTEHTGSLSAYLPYGYTNIPSTGFAAVSSVLSTLDIPQSSITSPAPTSAAFQTHMPVQATSAKPVMEADMIITTIRLLDGGATTVKIPRDASVVAWPYGRATNSTSLPSESMLGNQGVARPTTDLMGMIGQGYQGVDRTAVNGRNLTCTFKVGSGADECSGAAAADARACRLGSWIMLAWFTLHCWLSG